MGVRGRVVLGVVCVFACAAPAASARSWGTPQAVGDGASAAVASDRFGNGLVGYVDGAVSQGSVVHVRTLSPAGVLGPPATIAQAPPGVEIRDLDIGMDPDGDAVAAWLQVPGSAPFQIGAAVRAPGAPFGPAQVVATDVNGRPPGFGLSVASGGWAALVWDHFGPPDFAEAAIRAPGGAFGAPERVSPDEQTVDTPRVAIGPQGEALATWDNFGEGPEAAARPPGGPWGAVEKLAGNGFASSWPSPAIDDQGNALAAFVADGSVQARFRPAGGAFGAAEPLSQPPERHATTAGFFLPSPIGLDGQGAATVLWRDADSQQLFASVRPGGGGAFGQPSALSPDGVVSAGLAVSADGGAVAAWEPVTGQMDTSGPRPLLAAVRAAGAGFGSPETLSTAALGYDVATDGSGLGLLAWTASYGGSCSQVVVSGYSDLPAPGAQLAPPACAPQPPPPPPPPSADTTAPVVKLGGARRQHPLRRRRVVIALRCDEDCRATARGTLKLRGRRARRAGAPMRLKPKARRVAAGKSTKVPLRLSRKQARALRRALAGRRQKVVVKVAAADGAGNAATARRTITLIR